MADLVDALGEIRTEVDFGAGVARIDLAAIIPND